MKYEFIARHREEHTIQKMCQVLEVSSSGFYAWQKRQPGQREQANQSLLMDIREVYQQSHQSYGSPRIHAELRARGKAVNRKRVARLMRIHGIQAKRKQGYKTTTRRNPSREPAPNLIAQDFHAQRINEKWLADITYIDTAEGWLYLAAILDVYSRKIVGWSMSPHLDQQIVQDALSMAIARRELAPTLIHHSDQGSQYTSHGFLALLAQHNIQVSMSGVGNCFDNAMMESFFASLKTESITCRFPSRSEARQVIFHYIEVWYNRFRRHSALAYLSPDQYEQLVA